MLDGQALLDVWTAIGALGGIIAAFFAILGYRSRHGVPKFLPVLKEILTKGRLIEITQLDDEKNWWLISSVRLTRIRRKWLSETGPLYQEARWRRKIVFSPPSGRQQAEMLHPDASREEVLCLHVRLQANPFVRRRIKRTLFLDRA